MVILSYVVSAFRGGRVLYATMALSRSGCPDLKVYRDLLVYSLERQPYGSGTRVQLGQELQRKLFSRYDAFFGEFLFAGVMSIPGVAA